MIGVQTNLQVDGLVSYTRSLRPHLADAAKQTAERVAELAGQFVPVDTGALRRSIRVEVMDDLTLTVWAGDDAVDYAGYVEYGTRFMAAQPFMTPAALAGEGLFANAMRKAVQP